jgi:hypothetical protein
MQTKYAINIDTVPDMNAKHQQIRCVGMNILKIQIVSSWKLNNIALNRLKDMSGLNSQIEHKCFFLGDLLYQIIPAPENTVKVERWRTILTEQVVQVGHRIKNYRQWMNRKGGSDSNWHVQSTNGIISNDADITLPIWQPKGYIWDSNKYTSTEEFLLWSLWMETEISSCCFQVRS